MAKFHEMMKPILNMLKDGGDFQSRQIRELMNQLFPLTDEEMARKLGSGRKADSSEEVQWALLYLTRAGLLNNPTRGIYTITDEGLKVLLEDPEIIDNAYLSKYESFKTFMAPKNQKESAPEPEPFKNMLLVCAPHKTYISYRSEMNNHPHSSDFISVRHNVFVDELIDSIRNHNTNEFRRKYTQSKVLILYNVEFFAGKEATQEELYNIIQARLDLNLKTVIFSTEPPNTLSKDLIKNLYELLTIESVINEIPEPPAETDSFNPCIDNYSDGHIDIQHFKEKLQIVKEQLENDEIDEIPFDSRPKMLNFDFENDSYVIISYSRKDFDKVYLLLAQLYNNGYRFWYDNGMQGTTEWLDEYRNKFKNRNCLGTIIFSATIMFLILQRKN